MKKAILLITISLSLGLAVICIMLFSKTNDFKSQLSQAKNMVKSAQEEMSRLQAEKEKIAKDNDKLKADALSFVELNTKLQAEKDKALKSQQDIEKTIKASEVVLEAVRAKFEGLLKEVELNKAELSKRDELVKQMEYLKKKMISLDATLKKERVLYHYNLGVAYSQAKLYDEAVEEYEKSLQYNSLNADAHYNLGLLFENIKMDPQRAIEHYRKYLEIKPDTADKEEVAGWITKLEAIIRAKTQKK